MGGTKRKTTSAMMMVEQTTPLRMAFLVHFQPDDLLRTTEDDRATQKGTDHNLHFHAIIQKAADVWKKDVWDFRRFPRHFLNCDFPLVNEGKDGKNLNSQTWPGTPRRPSSRHPRPPEFSSESFSFCGFS